MKHPLILLTTSLALTGLLHGHPDHAAPQDDPPQHDLRFVQLGQTPLANKVSLTPEGKFVTIESNGIPDHQPGEFPRRGNPNAIKPQSYHFRVPLHPQAASEPVQRGGYWWGVAINGVPFEPGTGEAWNNDMRSGWRYEAATGFLNLGLDEHNAHVQPNGAYHYHALPTGLVEKKGGDQKNMLLVAWAADGFPVYTAQAHTDPKDPQSPLRRMKSSYQLKKGTRPEPPTGPGGVYDGRFAQDFTYVKGSGDLDECNGRFGVTPEFPKGTYYYCISAEFPFVARLWRGEPDASFRKADMPPGSGPRPAPIGGAPRGIMEGPPLPGDTENKPDAAPPTAGPQRTPLISALDQNADGILDRHELENAIDAMKTLDKNSDGKLTPEEYRGTPPGGNRPGGPGAQRPPQ